MAALSITDNQKTTIIDPIDAMLDSAFTSGVTAPSTPSVLPKMDRYASLASADRLAVRVAFKQVVAALIKAINVDTPLSGGGGGLALGGSAPPDIAAAGSVGIATTAAKSDHTHGHGNLAGGSLHAAATGATAGFMSATDKSKLDGIAAGANDYTLPIASAGTLGGVKVGAGLGIDGAGVLSVTGGGGGGIVITGMQLNNIGQVFTAGTSAAVLSDGNPPVFDYDNGTGAGFP